MSLTVGFEAQMRMAADAEREKRLERFRGDTFEEWQRRALDGPLAELTKAHYHRTYARWSQFAAAHEFDPKLLTAANIAGFLGSLEVSASTRVWHTDHLIYLLKWAARHSPYYEEHLLKVQRAVAPWRKKAAQEAVSYAERERLAPEHLRALLTAWDAAGYIGCRKSVIMRIFAFTAIRRAELCALRWSDWLGDVLLVRHGKGGKARELAITDPSGRTQEFIERLRGLQPWESPLMFRAMRRDKMMDPARVNEVVKQAMEIARARGVEMPNVSPHVLRKEWTTIAFQHGADIEKDLQPQLGHSDARTTRRYIAPELAEARRNRIEFPALA